MLTDDDLMEKACNTMGCTNYAQPHYAHCSECKNGRIFSLPKDLAKRKLALEEERGRK